MSSTEILETHDEPTARESTARTAERMRLAAAATRMRGLAVETALTAMTALADLAKTGGSAAESQAMAAVIAREVGQRARNVDHEVARLIARGERPTGPRLRS
jgi:hypothetical protein